LGWIFIVYKWFSVSAMSQALRHQKNKKISRDVFLSTDVRDSG